MSERRPRSSARPRVPGCFRPWLVALAGAIGPAAGAAGPPGDPRAGARLDLTNGGFATGAVRDSDRAGVLRWQSPSFTGPFEFDLNMVEGVVFPLPAELPGPVGDACFEMVGGDLLFGTLVDLDDRRVVLDASRLGRLHVDRSQVLRMERIRDRAALVYLGPNGLRDWREPSPKGSWRDEAGRLSTAREKATLRGDFALPAQAVVEFEIGWLKQPDFVLAFGVGVGDDEATQQNGFRFEVWGDDLAALRETADRLALATVAKVAPGRGRVHLRAYLDQEQGRLLVTSPGGEVLADLKLAGSMPRVLGGIALSNIRGDVRLERLRVGHWDGEAPRPNLANRPHVRRDDGSIVEGRVTRFDPASREFVVTEGTGETRVAEGQAAHIVLAPDDDGPVREIRVVTKDGNRLSGESFRVEKDELRLAVSGLEEVPRLPVAELRSLSVLRHEPHPMVAGKEGVLELEAASARLPGRLADGPPEAGASCLAWKPQGSATASHLRPDASGKIVLKDPPPSRPAEPQRPARAVQPPQGVRVMVQPPQGVRVIVQQANGRMVVQMQEDPTRPAPRSTLSNARPSLHLRTGDIIPAEVTGIDGDGVWFRSKLSTNTFVAHDKVKAVELAPEDRDAIRVGKSKRERLLTLPRMQKEAPPTHLIRSKDGDYLRGRVVAMDDATLQVEVRLETKDVPRDRISRIIWLHADELGASQGSPKPAEGAQGLRVQALRSNGDRLTFVAERMAEVTLSGPSPVLGDCRVALTEVEQLLIGDAIEQAAAQLAYQRWKLQNATEPRVALGDEGAAPGTEAALVGKPAPDFELELLGGAKFHLADARDQGRVVVLDFWATWCGPCMQAMPQVERVAREFRDRGVQLVAVNLQEPPERISAMLERHQLHPAVALDRDGTVAEKYGATAIPQTVVITRDGTIARLFVGGGPHLGDQLRDALNAVLTGEGKDAGAP